MSNKLKCVKHDRRILATETSFLHKTGDCSPCDGTTATIGEKTILAGRRWEGENDATRQLLMDLFEKAIRMESLEGDFLNEEIHE